MDDSYPYNYTMESVRPSTLAYQCAPDHNYNLNLFAAEDHMAALSEVPEQESNKYLEPICFQDQALLQHKPQEHGLHDVEFCTPNQQGVAVPDKFVPLSDLALPPTMQDFPTTPITTPPSAAPDNPAVTPPVLNSLPAACAPVRTFVHAPVHTPPAVMATPRSAPVRAPSSDCSPTLTPKDIPTQLGEFQISKELQCDLAGGPLRNRKSKQRHTEEEADELLGRLYREAEVRAEERKVEVRDFLKQELQDKQHTMDSRLRSLHRSRREAKVSRVKNDEYSKSLKNIIRYLILNTDTRRPEPCQCRKMCGKRKAPPS